MKILLFGLLFVLMIATVSAEQRLPSKGESNWATSPVYGLESWLSVSYTGNGTLKQLNTTFNSLNVTSNLIVLGNIFGEIPDSFKKLNWTDLYVAEAATRYSLANFTSNYDARADRFNIENGTSLPFSNFRIENGTALPFSNFRGENVSKFEQNPSNATISIPEAQITDFHSYLLKAGGTITNGLKIGSGGSNITGVFKGNLADDTSGWVPDGAATSFTITADAASVASSSVISVSLGANADAGAVCGVTTRTASTNFVVGCASSPDNGATLQYVIIN